MWRRGALITANLCSSFGGELQEVEDSHGERSVFLGSLSLRVSEHLVFGLGFMGLGL